MCIYIDKNLYGFAFIHIYICIESVPIYVKKLRYVWMYISFYISLYKYRYACVYEDKYINRYRYEE